MSPNSNILFRTQAALDAKTTEILRVVDEIQTHSRPVIEHAYREFLLQNHDPDEREYPDAAEPECWALNGLDRMQAFGYTLYNLWRYEYGY